MPQNQTGELDYDKLLISLPGQNSQPGALCVATPFLRPSALGDFSKSPKVLPESSFGESSEDVSRHETDSQAETLRHLYAAIATEAVHRRTPGQAIVFTGHCYIQGGCISDLSERRILGGSLHALPSDIFPTEASYVALGHLHRPQTIGVAPPLRYSGSPIPLSLDESDYPHQIVLIEFAEGRLAHSEALLIPRATDILRLPSATEWFESRAAREALRGCQTPKRNHPRRCGHFSIFGALRQTYARTARAN
ncbi:hypothetical protein CCP2SC5_1230011 [Azospirillaceae bacterium]